MLEMAEKKEKEMDLPVKIDWRVGDALNLDFEDGSFDLVTSGYMLRNVTDILKAVSEMHRVLAPGGKVVVAELSKPKNAVVRFFYNIYMKRVKRYGRKYDKGKSIDGRQSAYQWLTTSIEGFPYGEDMVKIFKKAGFEDARYYVKSFGAVNIYVGSK
jgi:demethylmenaquinone methyltransferase/2-methoxy-6-polyprenyl-1,4-benzoquinol methylase